MGSVTRDLFKRQMISWRAHMDCLLLDDYTFRFIYFFLNFFFLSTRNSNNRKPKTG